MGRDRDPFDRTLEMLRRRLVENGPLQGAPLSVNGLAAELGVSPTPVREALARLAGEGLVDRTVAGYVGLVHDAASLAGLYSLAGILCVQLARGDLEGANQSRSPKETFVRLSERADSRVLAAAINRTLAQLAPFGAAEALVLSPERWPIDPEDIHEFIRRYFARRARRSQAILVAAVTANARSRI